METTNQRSSKLRNALTNNGNGYSAGSKVVHFMENNDTPRFIVNHQIDRTKMAAGLLFSLNGIPMMFNGQETGVATHPYNMWSIFSDGRTIKSYDTQGLFYHYKNLIQLRKKYPSLRSDNYQEIPVTPGSSAFGFRRWLGNENIFTVLNMSGSSASLILNLQTDKLALDTNKVYYLTNLLSGEVKSGKIPEFNNLDVTMAKYSANIYLFADSAAVITGIDGSENNNSLPADFALYQNYPNPFNPVTAINYTIAETGVVNLTVYDVLGREVAALVNMVQSPGKYSVRFNGSNLASGVYLYRIEQNGYSLSKKMMMIK